MITLKTYGGLANRMRVIDSAYQVSRIVKQDLKVIWEMSYELNCSFLKLFKPVEQFLLEEYYISRYPKKIKSLFQKSLRIAGINLPLGYQRYLYNRDIEKAKENKDVIKLLTDFKSVYICSVHQFYSNDDSFEYFIPIDEISEKVEKLKEKFSHNTIGIHIRRTDNVMSIKSSPREAFVARMQHAVDEDADTCFFLATDSLDEENYLNSIFQGRIISHKKDLRRDSEKGIQDALVDLYCLANSKKIIGSFYSSFSEVAAQISNIPLELVNINS